MAHEETPAQWWVKEMVEDADSERVTELAGMIFEACAYEERFSRSEMYMAQAKALAITLMDAGRSGRNPEYLKGAACEIMAHWLDQIGEHIRQKQH